MTLCNVRGVARNHESTAPWFCSEFQLIVQVSWFKLKVLAEHHSGLQQVAAFKYKAFKAKFQPGQPTDTTHTSVHMAAGVPTFGHHGYDYEDAP